MKKAFFTHFSPLPLLGILSLILSLSSVTAQEIKLTTAQKAGDKIILRLNGEGPLTISGVSETPEWGQKEYTLQTTDLIVQGNVSEFTCKRAQLTSLDVTAAPNLKRLDCYNNLLTSLDLSNNANLTLLMLNNNELTHLDLSACSQLESLSVSENRLKTLALDACTSLSELSCSYNPISSLDLSACSALTGVDCSSCLLTSLTLGSLDDLYSVYCSNNLLDAIDFSGCSSVADIACHQNKLSHDQMQEMLSSLPAGTPDESSITIINTTHPAERNRCTTADAAIAKEKNWALVDCHDEEYIPYEGSSDTAVDTSGIITLTTNKQIGETLTMRIFATSAVQLTGLEGTFASDRDVTYKIVSNEIKIEGDIVEFTCAEQGLTTLDLSLCPNLSVLDCSGNQLENLNLQNNKELVVLICSDNQLQELQVATCPNLSKLWCSNNPIGSLDLSECKELGALWCYNCNLSELDLRHNPYLSGIDCYKNNLTSLDLYTQDQLGRIACQDNQLTRLDLSGKLFLDEAICRNNQLSELLLSGCDFLQTLKCDGNALSEIDLSVCDQLIEFIGHNNQFKTLDFTANKTIETIWCFGNFITKEDMTHLVTSLRTIPADAYQQLMLVNTGTVEEKNSATIEDIAILASKNWRPLDYQNGINNGEGVPYEGLDDAIDNIQHIGNYAYIANAHTLVVHSWAHAPIEVYSIEGLLLAQTTADSAGKAILQIPGTENILIVRIAQKQTIKVINNKL